MALGPMGWSYRNRAVESFLAHSETPIFCSTAALLRDSGKGKTVLPFKALEQVCGSFPIHDQKIGDCVSHGWSTCVDILLALLVTAKKSSWAGETATEAVYALSRVEVGKGACGTQDGSVGAWAADAVTKYGTLRRQKYGAIDLSRYDANLAKRWGMPQAGLPNELEPVAKEHPVQTTSLVTSYEEARDAIANGYPVAVCSNQGFADSRDADGFARPQGSWGHCMAFIGVDDAARPGLLCMNSWGPNWISGPTKHGQPPGSFWVDASTCSKMLRTQPDSFALSGFVGFPKQDVSRWIMV